MGITPAFYDSYMLEPLESHGFASLSCYSPRVDRTTESGLIVGVYWPRAMAAAEARTTTRVDNMVEGY